MNVFGEAVKTNFIKSWLFEYMCGKHSVWQNEVHQSTLLQIRIRVVWRKSIRALIWVLSWTSYLLLSWNIIFVRKNYWQGMVIQIWIFSRHLLKWTVNLLPQRTQSLLPMMKFELSSKSENFGKPVSIILSWITSEYLKIFQMRSVVLMTNFWWNVNEMYQRLEALNIWMTLNRCFTTIQCLWW